MKKKTVSSLKKKAWKIFSQYIRLKASIGGYCYCYTCIAVKPWKEMQAGHLLDGRTNSILFDERGVKVQCYACNCMRSGNKEVYIPKFIDNEGRELYDELVRQKNETVKWSVSDLEEMIIDFKQKLKGADQYL